MKHSEIMIAVREMENGQDNYVAERDRRSLEQHGWMVVMFTRDFNLWAKVARLLVSRGTVKKSEVEALIQEVDRPTGTP